MLFVNVLKKNADAELAFLKSYYLFKYYKHKCSVTYNSQSLESSFI